MKIRYKDEYWNEKKNNDDYPNFGDCDPFLVVEFL